MRSAISWFEIPVADISRATKFYEDIFAYKLIPMDMPGMKMRIFPVEENMQDITGALVETDQYHQPSAKEGVLIYLNGNPEIKVVLDKVEAAGGKIIMDKTEISPDYGFMGIFIDTEGNRIGIHGAPEKYLIKQGLKD